MATYKNLEKECESFFRAYSMEQMFHLPASVQIFWWRGKSVAKRNGIQRYNHSNTVEGTRFIVDRIPDDTAQLIEKLLDRIITLETEVIELKEPK